MADEEQTLAPRRGYDLVAPHYEAWRWFKLWRRNEGPIVSQWLESLAPGVGLDAGAGTGHYAVQAESLGHRCTALDISLQMLRIGRATAIRQRRRRAILYLEADVGLLPIRDSCLDWVLCSRVLSHLPDPAPALREFAEALANGAECLISDVHPDHPYTHVSVNVDGRDIVLYAYKHSLQRVVAAATDEGRFELLSMKEFYLEDLVVKPPHEGFAKLFRQPNPAVFYICRFRRCER